MLRTILKLAYARQKSLVRCYARHTRNPGVDRRLKLLSNDQLQDNAVEDPEKYEDADFTQLHKSHKQYEREVQQYRDRLQTWIVGNKYFRTKQLNFLTWSEKEQIRYLSSTDPEEWSIDKLVESFPADRYTIAKIVKAKWTPRDAGRIQRHDEVVRENWELFKSGRIRNIDEGFAQHLKKFVHRNNQEIEKPKVQTRRLYEIQQLPEGGEFSQIITSCKKYAYADNPEAQSDVKQILGRQQEDNVPKIAFKAPADNMFIMGQLSDRSHKTLGQMKKEGTVTASSEDEISLPEVSESNTFWNVKKYETQPDSFVATEEESKPDIQEFIRIPKKLYKQGATYQLDDCFYDDDGEFLYRVPGMTGNSSH